MPTINLMVAFSLGHKLRSLTSWRELLGSTRSGVSRRTLAVLTDRVPAHVDEDAAARAYDSAVRKRGLDRHLNFPAEAGRDEDEDANISSNVKAASTRRKKPTSSSSVSENEHDDEDKEAENSWSKADSSDQSPHFHHEVPSTVGTERVVDTDDGTTYWRAVVTTPSTGRVHYVKNDHGDQQTGNERFATEVSEWVSNLRVSRHVAYISQPHCYVHLFFCSAGRCCVCIRRLLRREGLHQAA